MNPFLLGALGPGMTPVLDSRAMPQQGPQPAGALSPQQGPPAPMGMPGAQFQGPPAPMMQQSPIRPAFNQWAQQMRQTAPNPAKRSWQYTLGSALLPALVGKIAGGSGREAMLYGIGSAAYNFNNQLEDYRDIERKIADAEAGLPSAEAAYNLQLAQTNAAQAKAAKDMGLFGPTGGQKFSGTLVKGRNGNLFRFNTATGQVEDTGIPFYEEPLKPSFKQVETVGADGRPTTVFYDPASGETQGTGFVKPPSPSEIKSADQAGDTLQKLESRQKQFAGQLLGLTETIDRAAGDVSPLSAGPLAALLAKTDMNVPWEDLKGDIDTLQANLSFLELNNMRANSPTGGALGNVTERELTLLGATVASLSQKQSNERLKANLMKVKQHLQNINRLMAQEFIQARERLGQRQQRVERGAPAAPSAPTQGEWRIESTSPRKSAQDYLNEAGP